MKILSKFKSFFKAKNKQAHDERIGFLANELIKELKASGRSISKSKISKGFGGFDISVYNLGTENESLKIFDLINNWEIETKPTFKEF